MAPLIGFNYHWTNTQEGKLLCFKAGKSTVSLISENVNDEDNKMTFDSYYHLMDISIDKRRKRTACTALEGKVVSL